MACGRNAWRVLLVSLIAGLLVSKGCSFYFSRAAPVPFPGGTEWSSRFQDYVLGAITVSFVETKLPERDKQGTWWDRLRYQCFGPQALHPWDGYGVDGGFPSTVLTGLEITDPSGRYILPRDMVRDLGNPTINHVGVRRNGKILELSMMNSDGAGGHAVLYEVDLAQSRARRFVRMVIEDDFTKTHTWTVLRKHKAKPRKERGVGAMDDQHLPAHPGKAGGT